MMSCFVSLSCFKRGVSWSGIGVCGIFPDIVGFFFGFNMREISLINSDHVTIFGILSLCEFILDKVCNLLVIWDRQWIVSSSVARSSSHSRDVNFLPRSWSCWINLQDLNTFDNSRDLWSLNLRVSFSFLIFWWLSICFIFLSFSLAWRGWGFITGSWTLAFLYETFFRIVILLDNNICWGWDWDWGWW